MSAHAQVSTGPSMERTGEPDRKDQREGPEDLLAIVRNDQKRLEQIKLSNMSSETNPQNNCRISDPSLPATDCPPAPPVVPRARGAVRHIVGPCPGLYRALHGGREPDRKGRRGGAADPPAIVQRTKGAPGCWADMKGRGLWFVLANPQIQLITPLLRCELPSPNSALLSRPKSIALPRVGARGANPITAILGAGYPNRAPKPPPPLRNLKKDARPV